jgi:hypothetical protein
MSKRALIPDDENQARLADGHIKEGLSRAFVIAIASMCGHNIEARINSTEFDYGIDGAFHTIRYLRGARSTSGLRLEFQMKATTKWSIRNSEVVYSLDASAFDKIVAQNSDPHPKIAPVILILLCLPEDQDTWLESSEEELLLRKCCYWAALNGDLTPNEESVTIRIPQTQHFTPSALSELLQKVKDGIPL